MGRLVKITNLLCEQYEKVQGSLVGGRFNTDKLKAQFYTWTKQAKKNKQTIFHNKF